MFHLADYSHCQIYHLFTSINFLYVSCLFPALLQHHFPGSNNVDLSLTDLQDMATRQQQQIENQQQMLVAKQQRLKFLKQQETKHQVRC